MELEVYWLQLAESKLEDIYGYYSLKAGKRIARKLVSGIVDKTIGLDKNPEIGQIETILEHRDQEFRYLVFKNYKIIYWINYEFKRIEIANVFDTRQSPEKMDDIP